MDSSNNSQGSFGYVLYKNNEDIRPILENTFQFGDYAILGIDNKKGRIYGHSLMTKSSYEIMINIKMLKNFTIIHSWWIEMM